MTPKAPPERTQTARAANRQALAGGRSRTLRGLSPPAGRSEKVSPEHPTQPRASVHASGCEIQPASFRPDAP